MTGERQPQRRRVDIDDAVLGVVGEHGLAQAQLPREGQGLGLRRDGGTIAYDSELVAVTAVWPAENAHYVVIGHPRSELPAPFAAAR
jgi:hypothetical protein